VQTSDRIKRVITGYIVVLFAFVFWRIRGTIMSEFSLNNFQNYIITNYYLLTAPISYGDSMERQPVQSCNLKSVGYDNTLKNLEIEFHSGLVYQYQNVPSQIYANLLSAQSTGTFFTDKIKNRYRSKRLDKITVQ